MGKRRQEHADTSKVEKEADVAMDDANSSNDDEDDKELVNVDFEFFDPQEHDFHGIKQLLRQLFDVDSSLLDLSALTDLILEQKLVGTTVKVDGREGDPYSFLTVVNLKIHQDQQCVKTLISYLKSKSVGTSLESTLGTLLAEDAPANFAIILSERLVNMPVEISPPSYNMLLEEINLAIEDNESYTFDHFLLISKVYAEIESKLDPEDARPLKRQKSKKKSALSSQVFNFHSEDDIFIGEAGSNGHTVYKYTNEQAEGVADSKRAFHDFGILPKGRMILLKREAFVSAVEKLQKSSS